VSGDARQVDGALERGLDAEKAGKLERAAAELDAVAWRDRARVLPHLTRVLEALTVVEHGMTFRYVPDGSFVMGDDVGEPDERPAHEVSVPGFWLSDTPISWAQFVRALDGPSASVTMEPNLGPLVRSMDGEFDHFLERDAVKIRRRYCRDTTASAREENPWGTKPAVAIPWNMADRLGMHLSSGTTKYRLPFECEWERAARGCFRDSEYPWGDEPPDDTRADFARFEDYSILPSRTFPPNDYGLFAMAGGVWEWCADHYDARYYDDSSREHPICVLPQSVAGRQHVVRGGSWADDAGVLRVSFRAALERAHCPNVGFRLVRKDTTLP
jgi:formylglycine-generating enzyme required for sulfatase activity